MKHLQHDDFGEKVGGAKKLYALLEDVRIWQMLS